MNKDDLQPWQQKVLVDIESYASTGKELAILMSGRGAGKSTFFNTPGAQQWMQAWLDDLNSPKPVSDIVLSEGRIYGSRYYTASPVGGSWADMEEWCTETFGHDGGAIWGHDPNKPPLPNERWYMNNSKFWFRNLKDRDWFVMRWSAT
jgi:hypothetical protein